MIENIAEVIPRLKMLGEKVNEHICLKLQVWVRPYATDIEWSVWDGHDHFNGTTIAEALLAAEENAGLRARNVPELLVMPEKES